MTTDTLASERPDIRRVAPAHARLIATLAWVFAAFGTVAGQLHALSRAASHPEDLASPLLAAWSVPSMDALRPLLDWGDPLFVYWTYGKIWLPVCLAFLAAAVLAYRSRRPVGAERVLWRVQLGAYGLLTLALTGDYYTPWTDLFFLVGLAAALVIGLGGAALGIVLLRRGFRPRTTAWLLIAFLPGFFVITEITSMGSVMLPLMWGWALAAESVARRATP
ncbi:hypothetical protein ARHIZOSPH14_12670 [Agromyces rhizosphaerae]|uniref:Uncharacterized protein n=1 Tax=Agromyces rhizosphaerae TaxID=88374 RepID=A0A9W6CVA2_9MICO|nr:hypothetical protein [Agromyces rhizosphaerae]GLI27025.1 hypothetical protein ARHIZOSPH14_12670 [Agromyces rhizosphaerae]